jgi:hypothetical protein
MSWSLFTSSSYDPRDWKPFVALKKRSGEEGQAQGQQSPRVIERTPSTANDRRDRKTDDGENQQDQVPAN